MSFPWKRILSFGLVAASVANPGLGAVLSGLIHSAEETIQGPGKGIEKAEQVVGALLDGLRAEGLPADRLNAIRDLAHNATDAIVSLENAVAAAKAVGHKA